MEPRSYEELSDSELLTLCCFREARNQPLEAKIAQCWSVKNRVMRPSWWGHDWHSVILKPWQYSSFNKDDANENVWPPDDPNHPEYQAGQDCQQSAEAVILGSITDTTDGATHYYDTSIEFPKKWGNESEWVNTLDIGHFRFWKLRPPADLSAQGDV